MKRIIKPLGFALLSLAGLLAGCQSKKVVQAPEPPVQNAFTDYVDRGITTMQKAQTVADKTNAQSAQVAAQAQTAGDAQ
jgi:hypothetical protein